LGLDRFSAGPSGRLTGVKELSVACPTPLRVPESLCDVDEVDGVIDHQKDLGAAVFIHPSPERHPQLGVVEDPQPHFGLRPHGCPSQWGDAAHRDLGGPMIEGELGVLGQVESASSDQLDHPLDCPLLHRSFVLVKEFGNHIVGDIAEANGVGLVREAGDVPVQDPKNETRPGVVGFVDYFKTAVVRPAYGEGVVLLPILGGLGSEIHGNVIKLR